MPSWGDILTEFKNAKKTELGTIPDCDSVRRKYLAELYGYTGRNTILYSTDFTGSQDPSPPADLLSISEVDVQGLMAVMQGLEGDKGLDLILHSPGGSPFAAEAMVRYLRSKFDDIRVIVPHLAMSAATMISCAADTIVMGKHSFLGPIDPQMPIMTQAGPSYAPAHAIRDQFAKAVIECADPAKMAAWLPMLHQYGPALLIQCDNAIALSEEIVLRWLKTYMFRNEPDGEAKAQSIAAWLSDHGNFYAHERHIPREELAMQGLVIENLEDDQEFQDKVLSVFHCVTHTFTFSTAKKIIENHLGKAFVLQHGTVYVQQQDSLRSKKLEMPRSQKRKKR